MRQTIRCRHFRDMTSHKTCRAGVEYDAVTLAKGTKECSLPCIVGARRDYNPLGATCDKRDMPTAEELAAEEAEIEKQCADMGTARKAIVAHLGGPWKRGTPGASGVIDCPVCGGQQTLRFSRAGYNGHVHAKCSVTKCVSWIE